MTVQNALQLALAHGALPELYLGTTFVRGHGTGALQGCVRSTSSVGSGSVLRISRSEKPRLDSVIFRMERSRCFRLRKGAAEG